MLGAEKEIITKYVTIGQVKIVHWPITDIGQHALDTMAAAYCVGEQDVGAYWRYHDLLYANYNATYRGDQAYLLEKAVEVGVDADAFTACYEGGEVHELVQMLNQERRRAGITQRPTYDVEGQLTFGVQPFSVFDEFIQNALADAGTE